MKSIIVELIQSHCCGAFSSMLPVVASHVELMPSDVVPVRYQ